MPMSYLIYPYLPPNTLFLHEKTKTEYRNNQEYKYAQVPERTRNKVPLEKEKVSKKAYLGWFLCKTSTFFRNMISFGVSCIRKKTQKEERKRMLEKDHQIMI